MNKNMLNMNLDVLLKSAVRNSISEQTSNLPKVETLMKRMLLNPRFLNKYQNFLLKKLKMHMNLCIKVM